jgi:hypothetical protein
MSSNVNTTRRRLDFGRKRNAPLLNPASLRSFSGNTSSFTGEEDILVAGAMKRAVDFYETATPLPEIKSGIEQREEAHTAAIRTILLDGPQREDAEECAALIRDTLRSRVEEQIKADEWFFSGIPAEKVI